MPHKIFGVNLPGIPTPQPKPFQTKQSPTSTPTAELNMDFKRPSGLVQLAKKHSSDRKGRSQSKDKHGNSSLPGSMPGSRQSSPSRGKPVTLGVHMESPPVMFIGSPQQSTGAIISGRLQITPKDRDVVLTNVTMYLEGKRTTKRPVENKCAKCSTQVEDLFDWNFFSKSKTFSVANGMSEIPFSHLLPGHLPATTHGQVGSLEYQLHVRATMSGEKDPIEIRRPFEIRRALIPGIDKNSTRIFPPTDLTLFVTLPHMIHPIGEFPVQCRMTGLTTKKEDTQTRWRLRKLTWRIEEHEKIVSPACMKHAYKLGEGKGLQHENTREIGMQELKSGWKTDFDEGQAEGEFLAAIEKKLEPNCGMEAPDGGLKISHHMVLELVIAEEWAPNKKPSSATPTGAARVLRTQFNLNVTERAGMGVSWDEEQPPMYEDVEGSPPRYPSKTASLLSYDDVPAIASGSGGVAADSPPHYAAEHTRMLDYEGDDLHEEVEHLNLDST